MLGTSDVENQPDSCDLLCAITMNCQCHSIKEMTEFLLFHNFFLSITNNRGHQRHGQDAWWRGGEGS